MTAAQAPADHGAPPAAGPHEPVAYLTGRYPRVTDTFIQREVNALRSIGTRVETYSVRPCDPSDILGPEQRAARAGTTYILSSPVWALISAHALLLLRGPVEYLRNLALAWRTRRRGLVASARQLAYFAEAGFVATDMRRRGLRHLHAHFADTATSVATLVAGFGHCSYSFTLHGSSVFFAAHEWQLGRKCDRAAFVACISYFARSQAMMFARPDTTARLALVRCGVDATGATVACHNHGGPIVFVGRLERGKGLGVLIEAMVELLAAHPDARLVVVGDGPSRAEAEMLAAELGVSHAVEFTGSIAQREVAEILGRASAFVLPSFAEGVTGVDHGSDGSGAAGRGDQCGRRRRVGGRRRDGDLVRPGDSQALAECLAALLADPELRARRGRAGRARVCREFDVTRSAVRLQRLFDAVAVGEEHVCRAVAETVG